MLYYIVENLERKGAAGIRPMGVDMSDWYRLDNAAKVFPPVSGERNSSVFRLSVVLHEEVDGELLQEATDHIYNRFPTLFLRLRSGVFWNYLDENRKVFLVEEERFYPCAAIDPKQNNGYLLKIYYYHNRISLEAYHSLTDGSGGFELLKSLVYYYLKLGGKPVEHEGKILLAEDEPSFHEGEDSFASYYEDVPAERKIIPDAYRIKGAQFEPYGHNVTTGVVDAKALSALAKAHGATITSYIVSLIIYTIYETRLKYSNNKKPVVVAVPVGLRGVFPTETLRNFFCLVNIEHVPAPGTSFEEIIPAVTAQLREKTEVENLKRIMSGNAKLERNMGSRLAPLFLKRWGIMFGFNFFGEVKKTLTFSNMGVVDIPKSASPYVKYFEVNLYPTPKSPINFSACSVDGKFTISFTRSIEESEIVRFFLRYLAQNCGLEVGLYTNNWGMEDAQM